MMRWILLLEDVVGGEGLAWHSRWPSAYFRLSTFWISAAHAVAVESGQALDSTSGPQHHYHILQLDTVSVRRPPMRRLKSMSLPDSGQVLHIPDPVVFNLQSTSRLLSVTWYDNGDVRTRSIASHCSSTLLLLHVCISVRWAARM